MKSYIKLYGPSIDKGVESLDDLLKHLKKRYPYGDMVSHIISVVDPSLDLITGQLIRKGRERFGEHDYIVEWEQEPTFDQIRGLIKSDRRGSHVHGMQVHRHYQVVACS